MSLQPLSQIISKSLNSTSSAALLDNDDDDVSVDNSRNKILFELLHRNCFYQLQFEAKN